MRVPTVFPRGLASRLKKSQQRLDLLERKGVVLTMRRPPFPEKLRAAVEQFAVEAASLQVDLHVMAAAAPPAQRAAIELMIVHARRLEERYAEASAPGESE